MGYFNDLNHYYCIVFRLAVASPLSGDQTYVSQEVCTSVLHECRGAIKRASTVSIMIYHVYVHVYMYILCL